MMFDGRLLSGIGVLSAVVESGNFVRAGEALGLTPSGVSRAVARLEERVGVRLFDRTPRAVALTEEGRRFYGHIAPLLTALEDAAADAAGAASAVRGRLRVNVDPWIAKLALVQRLSEFLRAHSELTVELVIRDSLGDLVADGFDVAVRFGEAVPSTLVSRKLLDTRIITCASPAYLDQNGTPRHPRDLEQHQCILFRDPASGRPFEWEFRRGRKSVRVAARGRLVLNELATQLAACASGLGVAQCIEFGLGPLLKTGALVQILPQWSDETWPLYAYYPTRHVPAAKVNVFMEFVSAIMAETAAEGVNVIRRSNGPTPLNSREIEEQR